jgi:glyoxylase-like metal-dependent hydrolase (beta-lactamase superfamily II)
VEHKAAHQPDYTMPIVVEFPDAHYELLDGSSEIWPGLTLIPTPGHTAGHQTLIVETAAGRIALAGQSCNTTSEFAAAELAWELSRSGWPHTSVYPEWMDLLQEYDPVKVLFAHDVATWSRGPAPPPAPASEAKASG